MNPNALPKRWRLPAGGANDLATVTTDELADLTILQPLFRYFIDTARKHAGTDERRGTGYLEMRPLLKRPTLMRIDPDLEALTEAEGLAMRPGPRPKINVDVAGARRTTKGRSSDQRFSSAPNEDKSEAGANPNVMQDKGHA